MFATFSYAIRNQKTGEYSTVEVMRNDVTVNLRCDDGTVIPVWGDTLRRLYRELTVVFQTEEKEVAR